MSQEKIMPEETKEDTQEDTIIPEDNKETTKEDKIITEETKGKTQEDTIIPEETKEDTQEDTIIPEANKETPDENTIEKPEFVKISKKAIIKSAPAEGTEGISSIAECYRSIPALLEYTQNMLEKYPECKKNELKIYLTEQDAAGKTEKKERVIVEGTLEEVIENLKKRVISPQNALAQLQTTVALLCDLSDLQGVLLTAVFAKKGVTGFGVLTESSEIDDTAKVLLGVSAAGQAEKYKDEMVKKGIKFPDDSGIITSGQANLPLLHLVK